MQKRCMMTVAQLRPLVHALSKDLQTVSVRHGDVTPDSHRKEFIRDDLLMKAGRVDDDEDAGDYDTTTAF